MLLRAQQSFLLELILKLNLLLLYPILEEQALVLYFEVLYQLLLFLCLNGGILLAAVQVLPQLLHLDHVLPLIIEQLGELLRYLLHPLLLAGQLRSQ